MGRIIFVTGTDTGVGKTLVTALLLCHLRERGAAAWAMKPFCTGDLGDVTLLESLQDGELSREEVNPFFFSEPLAPLAAARRCGRVIRLRDVLPRIESLAARCEWLIVEGAGGLLAPLGEKFFAADIISHLDCAVMVVAANKLGVLNHTLLTVRALQSARPAEVKVVLNRIGCGDQSVRSNAALLPELLGAGVDVIELPFLGDNVREARALRRGAKKIKKVLARISMSAIFTPVLSKGGRRKSR